MLGLWNILHLIFAIFQKTVGDDMHGYIFYEVKFLKVYNYEIPENNI